MRTPLAVVAVVHVLVLCAGFLAPYGYSVQHRESPLAPPAAIRFKGEAGAWSIRPYVCWPAPQVGCKKFAVRLFVRGARYQVLGTTADLHLFGVDEPARIFLLGTDAFGRDQFSRLLYGGRISLLAGEFGALVAVGAGMLLGAAAGYGGRLADAVVMRSVELTLALPWIYLLFGLRALLPLRVPPQTAFLLIIAVLGCVGWAVPARLVRGSVLSLKEREFVHAARGFGASHLYVLRRHILPHTSGIIITQLVLLIPRYVLAEVTLSFLGLGLQEPVPSWGNMLAGVQQFHVLTSCWWLLAPGFALIPVMLAYVRLSRLMNGRGRSETM